MAEGAGLALESRKDTLQKFHEMKGIELWPIDVDAPRVTNSVTIRVSVTQEVKDGRYLSRRRPSTKNPVLVSERGLGLMPMGRDRRR